MSLFFSNGVKCVSAFSVEQFSLQSTFRKNEKHVKFAQNTQATFKRTASILLKINLKCIYLYPQVIRTMAK